MKKSFWLPMMAVVTALALTACLKNEDDVVRCTPNSLERDRAIIDSFAFENDLNLTWDATDTGQIYVQIISEGTGSMPNLDSLVAFKMTAKLLSGSEILAADVTTATNSVRYYNNFIIAYSLRKLREGGSLKIIVPSRNNGLNCNEGRAENGNVIPSNSQIIYDVSLTDVKQ
ncbi:FKBP-type peptidyl-prolyl cis-trans isomerase [Niabella ginsengisoli]|uniref:Peptidylprolyl isomerase n=1 Tax=Niabella ginsengisoli TaxID=522298 RepID=A0ABS9SF69_9BACT|nr:hypothetical protein [Niabella ginsengisoli]MCH5597003.1 hypothetical protein [Niabella ginsengisoli]